MVLFGGFRKHRNLTAPLSLGCKADQNDEMWRKPQGGLAHHVKGGSEYRAIDNNAQRVVIRLAHEARFPPNTLHCRTRAPKDMLVRFHHSGEPTTHKAAWSKRRWHLILKSCKAAA